MKNYQEAIVTLKSGLKKYGKIVLEETENGTENALRFFTNESVNFKTICEEFISIGDILSIEVDLK